MCELASCTVATATLKTGWRLRSVPICPDEIHPAAQLVGPRALASLFNLLRPAVMAWWAVCAGDRLPILRKSTSNPTNTQMYFDCIGVVFECILINTFSTCIVINTLVLYLNTCENMFKYIHKYRFFPPHIGKHQMHIKVNTLIICCKTYPIHLKIHVNTFYKYTYIFFHI